jgi:hypothetical protein
MTPTISRRPSLAELLSPGEWTLLEQTLDEVLREQWGPDRYEAYTQPGRVPAGLTPLPTATETSDGLIESTRPAR